jgi:2,3-bisphosphoglycerate-independent phosphoglycerate mutase
MTNQSLLLFFIDGLGIGLRDEFNPLHLTESVAPLAHFKNETSDIIFDGIMIPTDASLGIEGRPQSASGQTTILTGVNAPQLLGYHKQGFPNQALRDVITENSIFRQLENLNIQPNIFANAYTPQFFTETPRWKSATTVAVEASETVKFRTLEDMQNGEAVFMDFTNSVLRARGFEAELWTAERAGKVLAEITKNHRFTLYEYFITDKIGHDQDFELAGKVLPDLAKMLRTVLENLDLESSTVIMTSDHGNIEDLSKRNHTLNQVPTVIWGRDKEKIAKNISSLADITPSIVQTLSGKI